MKFVTVAFFLFLSACAVSPIEQAQVPTQQPISNPEIKKPTKEQLEQKWNEIQSSKEYQREKAIFKKKLKGKDICLSADIEKFIQSRDLKPDSKCLYPLSAYGLGDLDPMTVPRVPSLYVMQVIPTGYLVKEGGLSDGDGILFIKKSDEKGFIDGSNLDNEDGWALYEYTGIFTYQTSVGTRTVHSFKKMPLHSVANARKGLKIYNPNNEILAGRGWYGLIKPKLEISE